MTSIAPARRRLAFTGEGLHVDVAVPLGGTVRGALSSIGFAFDSNRHALITRSGREVDPDSAVEELTDGSLVTVVDLTAASAPTSPTWEANATDRTDHYAAWWLLSTAAIMLAAASLSDLAGGTTLLNDSNRLPVTAALGVGAMTAGTLWTMRTVRRGARDAATGFALTATSGLAFAAGVASVPHLAGATHLAVTVGLLSATVLMALIAMANPGRAVRGSIGAASLVFLVLAILWGTTLMLEWGTTTAAAISLGLVAPGIRWLPTLLLNLEDGYAINYEHFMSSRWSVRGAVPEDPGPVTMDVVKPHVQESIAKLTTGVVMMSVLAVVVTPLVIPGLHSSLLVRIGTIGVLAATIGALFLSARHSSSPALRWVPRIAAVLMSLLVVLDVALRSTDGSRIALAALLMAAAFLAAILIVPVGRGSSSLVWSRLGDTLEWLAVAVSLPMGLLSGDVIEAMRTVMAG